MIESRSTVAWGERLLRVDFLAGLVVGIIAIAIWLQAWDLPVGELSYIGPGFLPKLFGAGIAAGSVALMVWGLVQPPAHAERIELFFRGPVFVVIGILFFAAFIRGGPIGPIPVPQLGLLIVAPITVVLTGFGSREADIRELLVLGLGLGAAGTLLFVELLNLRLPVFPRFLEPWILQSFGFEWPMRVACAVEALLALGLARVFGFPITGFRSDKGLGR